MASTPLRPQKQKFALVGTALSVRLRIHPLFITLGLCSGFSIPASAQITYEGGKAAAQSSPGTFNIPISEGQQTGGNVFHSFGTFGLPTNQVANFEANNSVQNILGRVTGGQPSSIDGKIQVTDTLGNPAAANLYLMNPAGIIFGQNASLDINGAFTATTARAIRFGTGEWFNALGGNNYPAIDPKQSIDFAFTDKPGGIFNAANLMTKPGQSITLVGGTVISTGGIKTNGGNISIVTAPDGKYVQIKADGSILRLDLPIADKTNIDATQKTLARVSLPALLTGRIDSTATGVKIEGDKVKLVGDKTTIEAAQAAGDTVSKLDRPIASGDIITRNLDTGNLPNGGGIYLDSSSAILTGKVTTTVGDSFDSDSAFKKGGTVFINALAEIKTGQINSSGQDFGGNVTLSSEAADIIVDSVVATGRKRSVDFLSPELSKGGNLTVKTKLGVFRVIKFIREDQIVPPLEAINLTTREAERFEVFSINIEPFGNINITHREGSFVTGAKLFPNDPSSALSRGQLPPSSKFVFRPDDSGSLGLIISSRVTNGTIQVSLVDGVFKDLNGNVVPGASITAVPQPKNNPDEQAARQKSKQDCTPSSTAVAANSTTDPNRAVGDANTPTADPCQLVTGTAGGTLQILNNRE
jgi:filamentous hemagglutinin family protein